MRSISGITLGIAALTQVSVAAPAAVGQADPHACSYVVAADWLKITGRKDYANEGPRSSKPGELKEGTTECDFLTISMTVTSKMTPAWFTRDKQTSEKNPKWKVESVSGLGDEAYWMWDPRPGENRNVGLVIRQGDKRVSIGELADSVDQSKPIIMQLAKAALAKMK